jgi:hypothetical protein
MPMPHKGREKNFCHLLDNGQYKSLFAIWCLSQKRAIFRQFFTFLKAHSGATQLKKDEKMAEKSLFGPSDQIANKL